MRKTLFSLALAMAVLSSCSSDDIVNNPMNEENHSFPASRSLHENILSFSSEEEYNALLDSLGTLSVSIRPRACFSPSYNKVKSQTKHVWLLTLL